MEETIMVSVVVITYNHEKFIKKALNSILMQKTDFPIEILVGDDCSSDRTPQIVDKYRRKYPEKIHAALRKKNVGATRNSYELFMKARGKYIAVLEGDDYWIDPYKLQKQVDFLENNPSYSACTCQFHYANERGEYFSAKRERILKQALYFDGKVYTLRELNQSKLPSQAGTMVYRNIFRQGVSGKIIYKAHPMIGDFTIIVLLLSRGNIYRLDDVMTCYRHINSSGSSWTASTACNPYHLYDLFMYHTKLENYSKKVLNIDVDLRVMKERSLLGTLMDQYRYPSRGKRQCIIDMYRKTGHKLFYAMDLFKAIYPSTISPMFRRVIIYNMYEIESRKTWNDFYRETEDKKIVLFGAGGACRELLDKYFDKLRVEFIVDNSKNAQGSYIYGYKIKAPAVLKEMDMDKTAVLITSVDYYDKMIRQCESLGVKHYYVYSTLECSLWRYDFFKARLKNEVYL